MRDVVARTSIRLRIGLAILAASALALVLMAAGIYASFDKYLRDNFDDTVATRADANLALLTITTASVSLRLPVSGPQNPTNGEAILRLYGAGGAVLTDGSPNVPAVPAETQLVQATTNSGHQARATIDYGGSAFRVLALPVLNGGRVQAVLVTAMQLDPVTEPLAFLRTVLFLAVPTTSIVLAIAGFLIARRALRPVHNITATARTIAGGDLSERIEGIHSKDEVGELATTFNTMIARLEETLDRERRFTADASHELRTPLTAIETNIDVSLSRERSPEEYRGSLLAVRTQTRRLGRLVQQLLALSRFDARAALDFEPVDVGEVLAAVVESFLEQHPDAAIALTTSPPDARILVRADLETLFRAFVNVIENALVHAGEAVPIEVTLSGETGRAVVLIHDDGPGIPPEFAATAFQRFRRGDASRTRGGTGLGLAIVESIVKLHGGSVAFVPAASGTTVRFEFPRLR